MPDNASFIQYLRKVGFSGTVYRNLTGLLPLLLVSLNSGESIPLTVNNEGLCRQVVIKRQTAKPDPGRKFNPNQYFEGDDNSGKPSVRILVVRGILMNEAMTLIQSIPPDNSDSDDDEKKIRIVTLRAHR